MIPGTPQQPEVKVWNRKLSLLLIDIGHLAELQERELLISEVYSKQTTLSLEGINKILFFVVHKAVSIVPGI